MSILYNTTLLPQRVQNHVRCDSDMVYSQEGFTDAEVAYQLAHAAETKAPSIIAAVAVLSVLATIAIAMRILVRRQRKSGLKADDYTIISALVDTLYEKMAGNPILKSSRSCAGDHSFVLIMVLSLSPLRSYSG